MSRHGPVELWALLPEEERAAHTVELALLEPDTPCACGHTLLMHNPRGMCRALVDWCPCPGFRLPEPEADRA